MSPCRYSHCTKLNCSYLIATIVLCARASVSHDAGGLNGLSVSGYVFTFSVPSVITSPVHPAKQGEK